MSIQFYCARCSQPIEVDDPLAGRQARCPHCREVVVVPMQSTYDPGAPLPPPPPLASPIAPTRDASGPTTPPLPGSNAPLWGARGTPQPFPLGGTPAPASPRTHVASVCGTYALIFTLLACGLFVALLAGTAPTYWKAAATEPNITRFLERAPELQQQVVEQVPWAISADCGTRFFALAGWLFSLLGLYQDRRGNWKIWLSLSVSSLFLLCTCGGNALQMLAGR